MTAEVAILNKLAIALAADSAVTVQTIKGQAKVYNSANKLFALSRTQPVGIMIYGNAEFMGIPWETIIKECRRCLGQEAFPTIGEYADFFFKFLASSAYFQRRIRGAIRRAKYRRMVSRDQGRYGKEG